MLQITRQHVISAAHRLYDYDGRCERLHGHNYRIEVTIGAPTLDRQGMVVDFAEIKKHLFGALDAAWDHRTLLYVHDPLCGHLSAVLDDASLCPVPFNPTAENMAAYLGEEFFPAVLRQADLSRVLTVDSVVVHETEGSSARWSRS
ncbi:MAG: 6-carboxytetrahydropterin synthase [Desulfovibrio sp.]|nr:6-carboxytetrahydropterin synthase [Desulfovibrio sp.]